MDVGLPGYTETYANGPSEVATMGGMGSTSMFLLLLAAGVGAAAYKMRKKRQTDDEYFKADDEPSLIDKLKNPFNRGKKGDKDDDFDKVL